MQRERVLYICRGKVKDNFCVTIGEVSPKYLKFDDVIYKAKYFTLQMVLFQATVPVCLTLEFIRKESIFKIWQNRIPDRSQLSKTGTNQIKYMVGIQMPKFDYQNH
jgi:hypothetical protein